MADSETSIDEQPDLKKRARRRLVGASALVLLAAVVLPMVMDHEPRPANQDIQVRIPSQDGNAGFASKILPAKPAATPLPPVASVEPKAEAAPSPAPKPEAKAEVAPPAPKPAVEAKLAEKPAEKPVDKPAEKVVEKPAAKPAEKPADAKAAEKAPEAKPAEAAGAEQWVIQLGAYKEAGNVKLLLSKLKGMGVPAYTEKLDSPQGPRTRVRAGPFPSKEAAEKAKVKVKVIGVDGPIAPK